MIAKTCSIYPSPFGPMALAASCKGLTNCYFVNESITTKNMPKGDFSEHGALILMQAESQLREYFAGHRYSFEDLPLDLHHYGTNFQRDVWKALQDIPYGTTNSYLDIAMKIKNPKAVRAVGSANNQNPVLIIVPCHRVIGNDGTLKGYGGGANIKKGLLQLEGWEQLKEDVKYKKENAK